MGHITGPQDPVLPVVPINDLQLAVVADLDEGGFIQIIPGKNPLGQPVPSIQVAPGAMLVLIPNEVAAMIRPTVKQIKAQAPRKLGLVGGAGLPS